MAKLTITRADFFASIQDMGRQRTQHLGLAQSGVADEYSFFRANYLVGNPITTPVIEIITGSFQYYHRQPGNNGSYRGRHVCQGQQRPPVALAEFCPDA